MLEITNSFRNGMVHPQNYCRFIRCMEMVVPMLNPTSGKQTMGQSIFFSATQLF